MISAFGGISTVAVTGPRKEKGLVQMKKTMAGSAIKAGAVVLFCIGTIIMIVLLLGALPYLRSLQTIAGIGSGNAVWLIIMAIILVVVVLAVFCLFIYAFGDLVDSSSCTALATEEVASRISALEDAVARIDECTRAAKAAAGNSRAICRELESTNALLDALAKREPELNEATVPEIVDSPWREMEEQ